jgi:hypothetical protein
LIKKSDATACIRRFRNEVEAHMSSRTVKIRTDNAGELSRGLTDLLAEESGISIETSAPYSPEQNRMAERSNHTLMEKVRSFQFDSNLPTALWDELLQTAVYLTNRTLNRAISNESGKLVTPYEMWYKQKPNLSHLRVIGCRAYFHISKEKRADNKLGPRARDGYLFGYTGDHKYRLYDPIKLIVIKSRDVVFDEADIFRGKSRPEEAELATGTHTDMDRGNSTIHSEGTGAQQPKYIASYQDYRRTLLPSRRGGVAAQEALSVDPIGVRNAEPTTPEVGIIAEPCEESQPSPSHDFMDEDAEMLDVGTIEPHRGQDRVKLPQADVHKPAPVEVDHLSQKRCPPIAIGEISSRNGSFSNA